MAALAQGIVGGEMAWPLVFAGALFGVAMILLKVRSPMLVAVGMYLASADHLRDFPGRHGCAGCGNWLGSKAGHNEAQKTRTESVGVLIASGLIAGEALTGLLFATFRFRDIKIPQIFAEPSYLVGFVVLVILGFLMVRLPFANAGKPEDPAPPAVMM